MISRLKSSTIQQGLPKYRSVLADQSSLPSIPTIGTATAGIQQASVAFTPGGIAGTTYRVISTPDSITATGASSPITVTGLTAGTAYTFQVRAENAVGNSLYSNSSNSVTPTAPKPVVTGGTLTSDATYYYRTFTANGTLGVSVSTLNADVFMIAGGGGGGGSRNYSTPFVAQATGGAGGAGGFRYWNTNISSDQAITIGGGGAGGVQNNLAGAGGNTVFGSVTRSGGGRGGFGSTQPPAGGCGGGGGYYNDGQDTIGTLGGAGNVGSYSPVEGYAGTNGNTSATSGGAGGGIGGSPTTWNNGGAGGSYFGTTYGAGGNVVATVQTKTANTGYGGDARSGTGSSSGSAGASGIVVVRYTKSQVD